jgi:hypothetical protein
MHTIPVTTPELPLISEHRRLPSPAITPQALTWDRDHVWLSSRDLGTLYKIDIATWKIVEEIDPPGIVWAGVSSGNGNMCFTIGKGLNDDRYIYRYATNEGFIKQFACPEFTGSYVSFDGRNLYLSQWYKERILKFDDDGNILHEIGVGAEICGHTFADGMMYVLRGRENKDQPNKSEEWRIARLDPRKETPRVEDIAALPFAARSLTFDGELFWSNYRAKDTIISFAIPN